MSVIILLAVFVCSFKIIYIYITAINKNSALKNNKQKGSRENYIRLTQ